MNEWIRRVGKRQQIQRKKSDNTSASWKHEHECVLVPHAPHASDSVAAVTYCFAKHDSLGLGKDISNFHLIHHQSWWEERVSLARLIARMARDQQNCRQMQTNLYCNQKRVFARQLPKFVPPPRKLSSPVLFFHQYFCIVILLSAIPFPFNFKAHK
jgi:hypothetical protein